MIRLTYHKVKDLILRNAKCILQHSNYKLIKAILETNKGTCRLMQDSVSELLVSCCEWKKYLRKRKQNSTSPL